MFRKNPVNSRAQKWAPIQVLYRCPKQVLNALGRKIEERAVCVLGRTVLVFSALWLTTLLDGFLPRTGAVINMALSSYKEQLCLTSTSPSPGHPGPRGCCPDKTELTWACCKGNWGPGPQGQGPEVVCVEYPSWVQNPNSSPPRTERVLSMLEFPNTVNKKKC